jgi:hypothetical protein
MWIILHTATDAVRVNTDQIRMYGTVRKQYVNDVKGKTITVENTGTHSTLMFTDGWSLDVVESPADIDLIIHRATPLVRTGSLG